MLNLDQTNLLADSDLVALFGGEWFKAFLSRHLSSFKMEHEFLSVDFFKEGKAYRDFDPDRLKNTTNLKDLPCSLRLTNIQILEPEIFKLCQQLEKRFSRVFTCNLYFTPGPERNCFDYHVDHQLTYACQILGEKNWIFPMKDKAPLLHLGVPPFTADMVSEAQLTQILLSPGDSLLVPFGMVHKVEIHTDSPSLHLTFGSLEHTYDELIHYLIGQALKEAHLADHSKRGIEKQELVQIVNEFKAAIHNIGTDKFVSLFAGKMFADELKVTKQGRSYKKNISSNQD